MKTLKFRPFATVTHTEPGSEEEARFVGNELETRQSAKLDGSCDGSLALFNAGHSVSCTRTWCPCRDEK